MKPSLLKLLKSSHYKEHPRFLLPLVLCLLSFAQVEGEGTLGNEGGNEGKLLREVAHAYSSERNYAKAVEYWEQILTRARENKDRNWEYGALGDLGRGYRSLGNDVKAVEYWEQRLALARENKRRDWEVWILDDLGSVHRSLGNYATAIKCGEQSLVIAREIKSPRDEESALSNLGSVYHSLGNYNKAIEYEQQHLAFARENKNRGWESNALDKLEVNYRSLGNYNKAIESTQQGLAFARENKNRNWEDTLLGSLRRNYRSLGNYAKAIEYGKQRLAISRELEDRLGGSYVGYVLRDLERDYRSLGNYTKAIEYGEQRSALARKLKDRRGEGAALRDLERDYRSLGNYAKAIKYGEPRLAISRELEHRRGGGAAERRIYSHITSIEYGEQKLALARKLKDRHGEHAALGSLEDVHRFLDNYAKALEYGEQKLALARKLKDRHGEHAALGSLGAVHRFLDNYAKALEYGEQKLALARKLKDRRGELGALGSLGAVYHSLGNYAKALEYGEQELAISRELEDDVFMDELGALGSLGAVYHSLGNYAKALEYGEQRLAFARELNNDWAEGAALNDLGAAFFKAGNLTEAERRLVSGIQIWELNRQARYPSDEYKVSILEGQASTYQTLQQVRVAQNNSNAALEIAERGRARAFVDLLTQRLSSDDSNPSIPFAPYQDEIRQIAKMQNATLVQYSIIKDDFQIQGRPVERESVLYIWVIQPTGEITFRQVDLKPLWQKHNASLASLIIGNQEFIGVRSRSSTRFAKPQPSLPTLHQLLIDPIANFLPKDPTAHVVFIPQGSLFQVPFPALQDANSNYLIQKHTILTAPSIQVLALTRQQQQKLNRTPARRGKALVLGNPTMPRVSLFSEAPQQPLPPLPGAEAEARAIAPLLNTQAILGAQGTKAAITQKMPHASIIHLATHGLLDNVRGLGSAIALTPSGNDNGWLTAEEILDMELQADLVVLSACETGGGKITGDGVIGLSRSLISVGVPSVIVSLWSVPDAPTAELMQSFYQNLQKHPNKAQALRQAMLTTMKTHPAPRDWAAFTLIGEAE